MASTGQTTAASSSSSSLQPLKAGTVYKKICDFLNSSSLFDPEPTKIQSSNTVTNPYTNRKKRRYTDMIGDALQPSLASSISGKCYTKLRKLEHDLDVSITKRHSYISSKLQQPNNTAFNHHITRLLRFEIYNTFHIDASNDTSQNKWICKLQTKLFNPKQMDKPINPTDNALEYVYYHPLQSIISRIVIKLDKTCLSEQEDRSHEIEWNNPNWRHHNAAKPVSSASKALMDGFQIERKGNKNCAMDIYVYLAHWFIPFEPAANAKGKKQVLHQNQNALCKVSSALGNMLGLGFLSDNDYLDDCEQDDDIKQHVRYHSKAEILQLLGYYVRMHGLIRKDNSMAIDCDAALTKLIGAKTIYSASLWRTLVAKKHILPPDPIHIRHEICVSGEITKNAKIYDMLVKVPSLVATEASKLMEGVHDLHNASSENGYAMTIDSLNVQISDVLEEINDQNKEALLYEQYAKDPVSTVDVMVANQRENLQIINEFAANARARSSNYFAHSSVYPDIKRYLKKRQIEKQQQEQQDKDDNNHNHNR